MDPVLSVSYATIAAFFEATEGNFRNAVYVSCHCHYTKEPDARTFCSFPAMTADRSYCRLRMRKAFWELW